MAFDPKFSRLHLGAPGDRKSSGISAGDFSGRPFDMHGFRRCFRENWSAFLRSHFRNSVEIAAFFDTDEKTARLWLEGVNAPSGPFVARAVDAFPAALPMLMGRAA